ncbi:hypothetical protein H0H92_008604 [Tricholoma furcatifolium]|nr:hypothetical protein H0H92_008604 [Tricholoma furcatifolium]
MKPDEVPQLHEPTTEGSDIPEKRDADDVDSLINERLADEIQLEFLFRLSRLPSKITHTVKIVPLTFGGAISSIGPIGHWESFLTTTNAYLERIQLIPLVKAIGLDCHDPNVYGFWRVTVLNSVSITITYVTISLLALRHELFHWKPALLARYLAHAKGSFPGRYLPPTWLDRAFNLYEQRHAQTLLDKVQSRNHPAVDDHWEFMKVVQCVLRNIVASYFVALMMWLVLSQTGFKTLDALNLPHPAVPPLQVILWFLIHDTFNYFPHRIAHTPRGESGLLHNVLPHFLAETLTKFLRNTHKTHHRSKANLALAAWYCSLPELIFINLFPAIVGPIVTQMLADMTGYSDMWGTHLSTLYLWVFAAVASSVLVHTGYRSRWNDPGPHDEHHESAFAQPAVNFGTAGVWDTILGTRGTKFKEGDKQWRAQRDRQAALYAASRRSGIPLTRRQTLVVEQPATDEEWIDLRVIDDD